MVVATQLSSILFSFFCSFYLRRRRVEKKWRQNQKRRKMKGVSRRWVSQSKDLGWFSRADCARNPLWCLLAWGMFSQLRPFHFLADISICFHQQFSEMPTDFLLFLLWEGKFLFPLAVFLLISWVMLSTGLLSCLERGPSQPGLSSQPAAGPACSWQCGHFAGQQ